MSNVVLGNKEIADKLNSQWFQYVGSNLTTTREFCFYLTKKRYIHKSEIPLILTGMIDEHQCKIRKKTGLPYGMFPDTTSENFIIKCGGYKCMHELIPVSDVTIPFYIRAKFVEIKYSSWAVKNVAIKYLEHLLQINPVKEIDKIEYEISFYKKLDSTKYLIDVSSVVLDYQKNNNIKIYENIIIQIFTLEK